MTNEQLFAILRPIVLSVTGVPECILADGKPGAKAPSGAYASIRPRQSVTERGQANIYTKDIPGDLVEFDVRAQVIASCSINFFRGNALEYAERLKECNKRPDVSIALFKAGVGWGGTDAVNNLTGLQSAEWEQRAQITIRLMYEARNIAEVNNILHATVIAENEKAQELARVDVSA